MLIVYLCLSVGVHVDVDTCCKSIAGLTLFSTDDEHESPVVADCCQLTYESCCSTEDHEDEQGCASDCVFIQVLSEEQFVAHNGSTSPTAIELFDQGLTTPGIYTLGTSDSVTEEYRGPPSIPSKPSLFLFYQSQLTYG
jgi:hypothetical protein